MKEENFSLNESDSDLASFDFSEPVSSSEPQDMEKSHSLHTEANKQTPLRYYFYPTWRSQFWNLIVFFLLIALTIALSEYVPQLILKGPLFTLGSRTYYLYLPIAILLPFFVLGKILIKMYDAKYIIDDEGVEAQVGLVSFNFRQPRLRWEDIRGVEPNQTLWERFLGIGKVLIGSAMKEDVEIVMDGVANPRAIQLLLDGERKKRLEELKTGAMKVNQAVMRD